MTWSKPIWYTFVKSLSDFYFYTKVRVKIRDSFTKVNHSGILVTSKASVWYTFWNYWLPIPLASICCRVSRRNESLPGRWHDFTGKCVGPSRIHWSPTTGTFTQQLPLNPSNHPATNPTVLQSPFMYSGFRASSSMKPAYIGHGAQACPVPVQNTVNPPGNLGPLTLTSTTSSSKFTKILLCLELTMRDLGHSHLR
jgi:hypothetical protein